ncbi:hypothetical protein J2S59_000240 [Nocardioides massiliensis]|uniref:Uncharacterized protein n=1 Tax=Nocardioides massiliensis TaxID=1325935 RepID=A0ABT9NJ39_9ACTN|nr:hypothetical protein [Nocardioides massiliensis]MDP9820431.1 hypothetical protein [Nocardioides massiliensis]
MLGDIKVLGDEPRTVVGAPSSDEVVEADESSGGEAVSLDLASSGEAGCAASAAGELFVVPEVDVGQLVCQGAASFDAGESVVDGDAGDVGEVPGVGQGESGADVGEVGAGREVVPGVVTDRCSPSLGCSQDCSDRFDRVG